MKPKSKVIKLSPMQMSFVSFLAGHYVGLLHKQGLNVNNKTKAAAKGLAQRIMKKIGA